MVTFPTSATCVKVSDNPPGAGVPPPRVTGTDVRGSAAPHVPAGAASTSAGHATPPWVHDSATSHASTAARHSHVGGRTWHTPSVAAPAQVAQAWQSLRLSP